jgi:Domain of unknown function (DUF4167)
MNQIPQRRSGPVRPQAHHHRQHVGNPMQNYERYIARAREALLSGDVIEMENCYQHAEHYFRVMRGQGHERRS